MNPHTMVIDEGLGANAYNDLLQHSNHFTAIKLGYGTSLLTDKTLLEHKLTSTPPETLLYPGGTLYEYYMKHHTIEDYIKYVTDYGFKTVEVSNGCNTHSSADKKISIEYLKFYDFTVISEVGSKLGDINLKETREEIKTDLKNGADYIILEGRASGTAGIYNKDGDLTSIGNRLIESTPRGKLIVEAPLKKQQVHLMKRFGSDIGVGNIKPRDVLSVACLRRGLRGDTL